MIRHTKTDHTSTLNRDSQVPAPDFDVSFVTYEQRLSADPRWALSEGSRFFEGKSSVQDALHKIVKRLDELGVPYVVVGGLALFQHGYRRFTEDIDMLVTQEGLRRIHEALDGLGYLPAFRDSRHLRDTELGVKIEFLVEGQYPGDGKPKPVAFPNPADVGIEKDGIRYLTLPTLIELKLASGMTNSKRKRDLLDVVELIKLLALPKDFRTQLNPFVRRKFGDLWREAQTRYIRVLRNKSITPDTKDLDDLISRIPGEASELQAMRADGVTLDSEEGPGDGYARLVTTDPAVAKKYGMRDEAEVWDDNEPNEGPSRLPSTSDKPS